MQPLGTDLRKVVFVQIPDNPIVKGIRKHLKPFVFHVASLFIAELGGET